MSMNFRFHVITRPFSSVTRIASVFDSSVALIMESECVSSALFFSSASLISNQFLLGAATGNENRVCGLERSRLEQLLFVLLGSINFSPESRQPSPCRGRAPGFWQTLPPAGRGIIAEGRKPQSSVVPSCSSGMYFAASSTRSRTSSGESMCGSIGATTPTKMRWSGFMHFRIVFSTRTGSFSAASAM